MCKILEFKVTQHLSKKAEAITALAQNQTRVVVPAEEFAGYRWKKLKYGSVSGNVGTPRQLKPVNEGGGK